MLDVKEKPHMVERALLVGVYENKRDALLADNLILELHELVSTLNIGIVGETVLRANPIQARYILGKGKAHDLAEQITDLNADCLIFDNVLSPAQQRNWEKLVDITVIDRQEIILDIFASRAQTKEAKLQVELARLEYMMPRVKRAWSHLGRQGGGGGTGARGEGEQQIEVDRRILRKQIDGIKQELQHVKKVRATQRKERQRTPVPTAAIVGYTNAGKSSLLKHLTGADVLVADKLFATLDTTTRRIQLPNGHPLLLTDTVGFVRKLPHKLVDAFKATLEEAILANFLIHVLDVSHPEAQALHTTTMEVLKELGADEKNIITFLNKIDLCDDKEHLANMRALYPDALIGSIHTQEGIDQLTDAMAAQLDGQLTYLTLQIPHNRADLVALLHQQGKIIESKYEDDHVAINASIPSRLEPSFQKYRHPTKIKKG